MTISPSGRLVYFLLVDGTSTWKKTVQRIEPITGGSIFQEVQDGRGSTTYWFRTSAKNHRQRKAVRLAVQEIAPNCYWNLPE
jgi:hypothetical protein